MTNLTVVFVFLQLLFLVPNDVAGVAVDSTNPPLKVFVLAGQSNMVGRGSIKHLDMLVNVNCSSKASAPSDCPNYNDYRARLWNETHGGYKIKDNVYIRYHKVHGKLTVARDSGYSDPDRFGPEVMFGWTLGDAFTEQRDDENTAAATILIIKTAWGGKSLGVDFRPPSSGLGNFSKTKREEYGAYYSLMIDEVKETLSNLNKYVPTYNETDGYELAGFIWFQGWNDMISWPFVDEYGHNLVNLMRDVRRDLQVDSLPVVIGELGMHGTVLDPNGVGTPRVIAMRAQEHAVTLLDEFRGNSLFVRTAPFVVSNETQYDGDYHYFGRADTYFHIGQALGQGALKMLNLHSISDNYASNDLPRGRYEQYHSAGKRVTTTGWYLVWTALSTMYCALWFVLS